MTKREKKELMKAIVGFIGTILLYNFIFISYLVR